MTDDEIRDALIEPYNHGRALVLVVEYGRFTVIGMADAPAIKSAEVLAAATRDCPRDALVAVLGEMKS